jgi:positive regulator of sigma E activity
VTIATLLLGIAVDQNLNAPRVMSIALIFAALFIAFYAFAVYFRRLHLLTKGKPYGYIDHVVLQFLQLLC